MLLKCLTWRKVYSYNKPIKIFTKCVNKKGDTYLVVIEDYINDFYVKLHSSTVDEFCQIMTKNRFDVTHIEQIKKRLYYGGTECDVLYVKSTTPYRVIEKKLNPNFMQIVEGDINVLTKLFTSNDIDPCGFVDVDLSEIVNSDYKSRLLKRNILSISHRDIKKSQNSFEYYDKIFYFDIECENIHIVEEEEEGEDDIETSQKNTYKPTHINMISCVLNEHNNTDLYILSTYDFDIETIVDENIFSSIPIKIQCESEKDLLIRFFQLINTLNPDIISGYNILGFDWYQIINSAIHYNIDPSIYTLSTHDFFQEFPEFKGKYIDIKDVQSGSAKGRIESFAYLEHPFFNNLDVLKYTRRMFNMPNYTLKTVSTTLLKSELTKLDISYVVIRTVFAFLRKLNTCKTFEDGLKLTSDIELHVYIDDIRKFYELTQKTKTLQELKDSTRHICGRIAKYCIVDSLLCSHLDKKVEIMRTSKEIANLNRVTLEDVIMRGVTFRITSSLYKYAHEEDIILDFPTGDFKEENEKLEKNLQGAAVIEPRRGYYNGICTLDFASLYPCILMYFNLCASTLSFTKKENCNEIRCENVRPYYFTRERVGIIPKIMTDMMKQRKTLKVRMKTLDKNSEEYIVLDCKQKALKVTMNSAYGYTGSSYQPRAVLPIAISTTTKGRELLFQVRDFLVKRQWTVVYGDTDSNLVQPPIFSRYGSFNSKTLTNNILKHCDHFEKIDDTTIKVVSPIEQKTSVNNFSIDLSAYKTDDLINISHEIDTYLCRICTDISAEISDTINKQYNSEFDLEFEDAMEHWTISKKKMYIGRKYGSHDLIKKGVLSVKSNYSKSEARIYNNIAIAKFNGQSMSESLVDECVHLITDFNYGNFITNTKFETFIHYAEKVMGSLLDVDSGIIANTSGKLTKKEMSRLKINPAKTLGLQLAWNMHQRGETPPEHSQIEYVFVEHHTGEPYSKKADCVLDYERFYHMKNILKIKHILYLDRSLPQTSTLFSICNETVEEYDNYSCYMRCVQYFNLQLPPLYTLLEIAEDVLRCINGDIVTTSKVYNVIQTSKYLEENKIDYRILFTKKYNQPGTIKIKFKAKRKLIWIPLYECIKSYVTKMRQIENKTDIKSIFTTASTARVLKSDANIKSDIMHIHSRLVMDKYNDTPSRLFTRYYTKPCTGTAVSILKDNIKRHVTTNEVITLLKKNAAQFIRHMSCDMTTLRDIVDFFNVMHEYEKMVDDFIEKNKDSFIQLCEKKAGKKMTHCDIVWTLDGMRTVADSYKFVDDYTVYESEVLREMSKGVILLLKKTSIPTTDRLKDIQHRLNHDSDETYAWMNIDKIRQYFSDTYKIVEDGKIKMKRTMLNKTYFPTPYQYENDIAKSIRNQCASRIQLNREIKTYCHQF